MATISAYLCLGSNIDPHRNMRYAVQQLNEKFGGIKTSNLYLSPAVGFDGDDFLNLAVKIKTEMSLTALLDFTDSLEQAAGRVRAYRGRYDSRTLDVDVVMYGQLQGVHDGREWPSEDIQSNAHVLLPISEIAGDKHHPSSGIQFAQLWEDFDQGTQALKKVSQTW